jgi:hypothetical protein
MFAHFSEREFVGLSPVYAVLARHLAADPRPAVALLAAPSSQRRAILLFAAATSRSC